MVQGGDKSAGVGSQMKGAAMNAADKAQGALESAKQAFTK